MSEQTYTLAEAERALRLRDCVMYGHDWTTGPIAMCETQPRFIICERCGKTANVEAEGGRESREAGA